jgi:heterotetrameric sarcosine oxidase delta subunit
VSFSLQCPNCGLRPVAEFRFGGEYHARPSGDVPNEEWTAHLYSKRNLDGPQQEWWFHRFGCREWFFARRDTRDNRVLAVWLPEEVMSDER